MEYAQGAQYWDRRYREDPECFEWYHEYEEIEAVLRRYIKANDKVLVLGCGNSSKSPHDTCDTIVLLVIILSYLYHSLALL